MTLIRIVTEMTLIRIVYVLFPLFFQLLKTKFDDILSHKYTPLPFHRFYYDGSSA